MSIGLVKVSGWLVLDGIVAIAVALNILWTGYQLWVQLSALGLLDSGHRLKIMRAFGTP